METVTDFIFLGVRITVDGDCSLEIKRRLLFPSGSDGKESTCNTEDPGSIPGSGRSPGERNDNPLQYSCLENSMNREAWWAIVYGITKSQTQLSDLTLSLFSLEEKIRQSRTGY